jgi:hypothetical protein
MYQAFDGIGSKFLEGGTKKARQSNAERLDHRGVNYPTHQEDSQEGKATHVN